MSILQEQLLTTAEPKTTLSTQESFSQHHFHIKMKQTKKGGGINYKQCIHVRAR